MKKLLCFISHPFGGKQENIESVDRIIDLWPRNKSEHKLLGSAVPFAPWLPLARNWSEEDEDLAFDMIESLFASKAIDFVCVCSDVISSGMAKELNWAAKYGIPVYFKYGIDEESRNSIPYWSIMNRLYGFGELEQTRPIPGTTHVSDFLRMKRAHQVRDEIEFDPQDFNSQIAYLRGKITQEIIARKELEERFRKHIHSFQKAI